MIPQLCFCTFGKVGCSWSVKGLVSHDKMLTKDGDDMKNFKT